MGQPRGANRHHRGTPMLGPARRRRERHPQPRLQTDSSFLYPCLTAAMLGWVAGRAQNRLRPLEAATLHRDDAMAGSPQAGNRCASPASGPSPSRIAFWTQPRIKNRPTLPPLTPRRHRPFPVVQNDFPWPRYERRRARAERACEPMRLGPHCGQPRRGVTYFDPSAWGYLGLAAARLGRGRNRDGIGKRCRPLPLSA